MRRIVLALPLLAGSLALAGCGASSGGSTTAAAPSAAAAAPATAPSAADSAPAAPAAGALKISGYSYSPGTLTVSPGQVVTVTNSDSAAHTVSSDTKGAFSLDDISKGTPLTFKAPAKAGTYTYFCAYHPKMHGTLVVQG